MKKTILSFLLLFATLATFASRWTAPDVHDYSGRYVVYTQVMVNGSVTNNIEIAAFIGDEIRGVATSAGQNGLMSLQVYGTEADNGKSVTFKIAYDNLVYKSTKTLIYKHGETYSTVPFVLNVDAITGVSLTNPIELVQNIGTTYDLTSDITLLYEAMTPEGAPTSYQKKNETVLDADDTPLTYEWDFGNSSSWFKVETGNILTINGYGENKYLGLKVHGPASNSGQFEVGASTSVSITMPAVPVTGIELSQTTITVPVGTYLVRYLAGKVNVLPTDASNRDYKLIPNDDAAAAAVGGAEEYYEAKIPGTYSFKVASVENESIYENITIIITQPVTSLGWNREATFIELWTGDNAFTEIAKYITINPANATDKTLEFGCADADAFDETGIALKKGTFTVYVSAKVAGEGFNPLTIEVVVRERVENIRVTPNVINVKVGANVSSYIFDNVNINVLPETADNRRYRVQPSDADASFFPNFIASTAGTYTWEVVSDQNPEVTANITVNVITPVTFTVPSMIDLTILSPGQGTITDVTGDYDASLVTFGDVDDAVDVAISGTTITVYGQQLGDGAFEVFYDGESMGMTSFNVGAEIQLQSGWNWISNYTRSAIELKSSSSEGYLSSLFSGSNKILEARSQNDLLYNDSEKYGVFGTIDKFESNTMYKVCVEGARSLLPADYVEDASPLSITTKGYTWIGYPVVGDHSINYFNDNNLLNAYTGCIILGKDGFAEYNGSAWVSSSDFMLETGKGYIFYQPEARDLSLDFGDHYVSEATTSNVKAAFPSGNVWNYDASNFADNMAIVAKINGIKASSRYSVGAFVGDECRGKGEFVTDEIMFINVAGTAGETVNFRLYDRETGCYSCILEGMSYTMKKGSLSSPVTLTPESAVTGISNVESSNQSNVKIFNLQGQQVDSNAKGIVIIGGKKVVKK